MSLKHRRPLAELKHSRIEHSDSGINKSDLEMITETFKVYERTH